MTRRYKCKLEASWACFLPLYFIANLSKSMPETSKKIPSNNPPVNELASQYTQQPQPVTWSAHAPQSGSLPSPFPRHGHSLTATANGAGELFLFGGSAHGRETSDVYVFSTRDFSTTLLQPSGKVPTPRYGHCAALIGTTLLICGGRARFGDQNIQNHDSLYLLNLGTSYPFMSSSTPVDHSFALQECESGPAFWSIVPARAVVPTILQT
jgi:hypothetical protein